MQRYLSPPRNLLQATGVQAKLVMGTDGQKDQGLGPHLDFFSGCNRGEQKLGGMWHLCCQRCPWADAAIWVIRTSPGTLFRGGCSVPMTEITNGARSSHALGRANALTCMGKTCDDWSVTGQWCDMHSACNILILSKKQQGENTRCMFF